ncbi:amidohydrolase family protein [Falsiroseomonas sp.]|uniref:amidohydrolase family protein n=1 Tax=Falsiroseomonas sp. TaxID=2870721 RepID=UPI003F6E8C06
MPGLVMDGARTMLIRGGWVLTDPTTGAVQRDAAVRLLGNQVAEVGDAARLMAAYPELPVMGQADAVVMPGLIDAHSHGRGLSPIQKGVLYDYLENAFLDWSSMVYLPNELCAALSAVRHLRMGATAIHHTGWNDEGPRALEEAQAAINAYRRAGIRLAYSPAMRDRNRFCVDEQGFLETLPPAQRAFVEPLTRYDPVAIQDQYMALFEALHAAHDGPMSRIFHGPSWAHGTTDAFFARIRESAAAHGGLPIHIHTQQTPHQRAWSIKTYGHSLVTHLDRQGVLGPRTTLGHAVWLSEADIELMAARGASTTHHASCNLHVRNGISPIWHMIRAGVNVAMGIDDKSLNDDDDPFMELRLAATLSRVPDFDLGATPVLTAPQVLAMGTVNAARTLGFAPEHGRLVPGAPADLVVLDTASLLRDPWTSDRLSIPDLVLWRAKGQDVTDVVVDGKVVMRDRAITTMDVAALYKEVRDYVARHEAAPAPQARIDGINAVRPFFHEWHRRMLTHLDVSEPFYRMNGRA